MVCAVELAGSVSTACQRRDRRPSPPPWPARATALTWTPGPCLSVPVCVSVSPSPPEAAEQLQGLLCWPPWHPRPQKDPDILSFPLHLTPKATMDQEGVLVLSRPSTTSLSGSVGPLGPLGCGLSPHSEFSSRERQAGPGHPPNSLPPPPPGRGAP